MPAWVLRVPATSEQEILKATLFRAVPKDLMLTAPKLVMRCRLLRRVPSLTLQRLKGKGVTGKAFTPTCSSRNSHGMTPVRRSPGATELDPYLHEDLRENTQVHVADRRRKKVMQV